MKLKIRKGASVKVITGSEKGKQGTVLDVDTANMRLKVEGIKIQTKHTKEHGIKKAEGYIHYSNVALLEAAAKKKVSAKKTTKTTKAKNA